MAQNTPNYNIPKSTFSLRQQRSSDISSELDEIIAKMHGISSDNVTGQVQMGPTLTAMIEVEGKLLKP